MKFIAILTLLSCSIVFANPASTVEKAQTVIDAKKIDLLASTYFLNKYKQKKSFIESLTTEQRLPPGCDPHDPPLSANECIDVVCNKLGSFGCDQQSEITAVSAACRGVDGSCVDSVCNRLGSFGCDQMSEIQSVTNACRSVFDGRCVDVVCDKLGSFGCDQMSEITQVSTMCKGRIDSDCILNVCARLGSFGCDQMSELQQVAKSCGGQ